MESPKKSKNLAEIISWIFVLLSVPTSALVILGGMGASQGAPQEAVVICLGLAIVIIPYCFARAISELSK